MSSGQLLFIPSQTSVKSHSPVAVLHTAVDFKSVGHVALEPVHVSPKSQTPAETLQLKVFGWNTSVGQVAPEPEHCSATSHTPAEDLHVNVFGWNTSVGQLLFVPSHDSDTSQMPAEALHSAVDLASVGHVALEPVH